MRRSSARYRSSIASAVVLTTCCLWGGLWSCSAERSPAAEGADPGGAITVAIRLSKAAAASIARAEVVVTGSGMTEMREALTVRGDTLAGTVRGIPAGTGRRFTINGYDASGTLTYTGTATAEIVAGQQATVRITVRPAGAPIGLPQLRIAATATARRPTTSGGTTRITAEISNAGSGPATGVTVSLRATNSSGIAISDAEAAVGTVGPQESKLFDATFSGTCYSDGTYVGCRATYVSRVNYTVRYNEGADLTGTITVQ
ncbi:MAG: hypothetical protein AB1505_30980 [Candidatus Latescibacterota bacterium]